MATKNISAALKRAGKLTRRVTAALRTHAVPAAEKIDEGLRDEEGDAFAMGPALGAVADSLERRLGTYSASQRKVQAERRDDSAAQNTRDTLRDALHQKTSKVGRTINLLYGREVLSQMALVGTVPTTPDTLLTFVGDFLSATEGNGFVLPEVTDEHLTFNFPSARAEIAELHDSFARALETTIKEDKETQQARADRNRIYDAWLQELRFARDIARVVLVRSDQADLASRILPTDRQITGEDPLEEDEDDA